MSNSKTGGSGDDDDEKRRRFLTEKEAAERLGISVKTLQKWRYCECDEPESGKPRLPFHRLHETMIRYSIADIEAFEEACRH